MAALRQIVTGTSSATFEEARARALDLFREVNRAMPAIMDRYNLHEVITISELRKKLAAEWRKHSDVKNPKVIDMLVYKGQEEFENMVTQAKQRHHVLSTWVVGSGSAPSKPGAATHRAGIVTSHGESEFLRRFYESNEN